MVFLLNAWLLKQFILVVNYKLTALLPLESGNMCTWSYESYTNINAFNIEHKLPLGLVLQYGVLSTAL